MQQARDDPNPLDTAAVGRVAEGDAEALRLLYERHGRLVYAFAIRITSDPGLAEECTQDVFVALWRSASTFDPTRAKLTTWLLAIARNRAIELVRQRQRRPDLRPVVEIGGESADTADTVVAAYDAEVVAEAMADLPADQYEVVRLAYFDGLSHAEIAEVIGIPLGTVKGRMRLALARLRSLVDTDSLTPGAS